MTAVTTTTTATAVSSKSKSSPSILTPNAFNLTVNNNVPTFANLTFQTTPLLHITSFSIADTSTIAPVSRNSSKITQIISSSPPPLSTLLSSSSSLPSSSSSLSSSSPLSSWNAATATAAGPPTSSSGNSSISQQRLPQLSLPPTSAPSPRQVTTIPVQASRTTATIITSNKRPTIIIYPTVSPESIVIPIVSCIFGFPLLALMVICCLRRRAKLARERDRRRNYDMQDHAVSLVRFSPIHRLNNRSSRAISLRPERSLSRGFPSLELDTVIEERSDPEQTQTDIISPESPLDPHKFRDFNSS